jgi:hypothetical protein
MTDKEAIAMALDALETLMIERGSIYEKAIAALKERLAQEKALQTLHDENERLGLYRDAYTEREPLIGCVNHDCAKCKERTEQEPDYWLGYGLQAHTEKPFENATALYKDPPQRTEPPQKKKVLTFWDLSGGDITDAIKAKIKEKNQ